ncbi:MAG: ferric reductase-like transmembrane domain-containing protein [Hyphomicrobiales bacterium]
MTWVRVVLTWITLTITLSVPLIAAAASPLLAWRDPIYIAAGFAGILAMILLLVQPLLVGGYLPGISARRARQLHRGIGAILVLSVLVHVIGLWITSPPDVIDSLLFASPTPFSAWGVIAMWAIFAAALLGALKSRLRLRPSTWRFGHTALAVVTFVGCVVHAMLIEGTMEIISKVLICLLLLVAIVKTLADLRVWVMRTRGRM